MRDKLLRFVRENGLLEPGDRVVCAVSGGADSMALLWALHTLQQPLRIRVEAAHYHHGLRGADADADEAFVRNFCASHQIPFHAGHGDCAAAARAARQGLEQAARAMRYEFLLHCAGPDKLATAHTADDNLETLLIRLTRGTSLRGLGGIPVRRDQIIRPLLFAGRSDVEEFIQAEGIAFCKDGSNDTDFCLRNRLRHHVTPLLQQENPGVAAATLQLSAVLRQEDAYLSRLAAEALAATAESDGYRCERLLQMDPVLRRRALFAILQQTGVQTPGQSHLEQAEALLTSAHPSARMDFPDGAVLRRVYDLLIPGAPQRTEFAPISLQIPGETAIPALDMHITCERIENFQNSENSPTTFLLNYAMIQSLTVRPRQPGDRIRLRGGSRSVKRLLIDRRVPAEQRDRVAVLADDNGVVAVADIGADVTKLARAGEPALRVTIDREGSFHA